MSFKRKLKNITLTALFMGASFVCAQGQERNKAQGFCEQGGQTVTSSGLVSSTKVQRTYPGCTVTVYNPGTAVLATIYSDSGGTPKANPFTADASTGAWFFYALVGEYDIQFSGGGISPTFTRGDWLVPSASSGGAGSVGGTGTLNFIPRWTSTTNIDDSVMSQSGTTITTAGSQIISGGTTPLTIAQGVATTGSPNLISVTGGAHTGLTADTEAVDFNFNLARTVQFTAGVGTFSLQRAIRIQSPTYSATGAESITDAALIDIESPKAGTNMTITNGWAMRVGASAASHGGILFDHPINATGSSISWRINGSTIGQIKMATNVANFVLGQSALSTGATDGFVYIASMAGSPSSVPTSFGSTVPLVIDTVNQRLYGFMSGAWLNLSGSGGSGPAGVGTELQYRISGTTFGAVANSAVTTLGEIDLVPTARTVSAVTPALRVRTSADTVLGADIESPYIVFGGSALGASVVRQWTNGGSAFTNQREFQFINPTYAFVAADSITFPATVWIAGAPTAGTNATLTEPYALWIDSGTARFDGNVIGASSTGTNASGASLTFAPGTGTGTGVTTLVGNKYPLTAASGTTQQVLSTGFFPHWVQMFTHYSSDVTVANTTTETSIMGTVDDGSTKTIEAGLARVGRQFKITAGGTLDDTGTPTLRIRLKFGATVLGDTNTITLNHDGTITTWNYEGYAVINVTGAGGSITVYRGTFYYNVANGNTQISFGTGKTTTAVDFTAAQTWDLTAQWSAASVDNTITATWTAIEMAR